MSEFHRSLDRALTRDARPDDDPPCTCRGCDPVEPDPDAAWDGRVEDS